MTSHFRKAMGILKADTPKEPANRYAQKAMKRPKRSSSVLKKNPAISNIISRAELSSNKSLAKVGQLARRFSRSKRFE